MATNNSRNIYEWFYIHRPAQFVGNTITYVILQVSNDSILDL